MIDLERTEDDIEDLLYEVDFQAKCESPYLARYHGSWLWDNKLTIAMEYLGGGTLEEHNRKLIPEAHCAYILGQILRALDYLHRNLKIHRDIKSANFLFTEKGEIKLADFGVAAALSYKKVWRNTFVGTPLYISPEIIESLDYNYKVDIWSLGILAIEIATGSCPRLNQHPMDILYSVPKDPSPQLPGSFSAEFRDFVSRTTEKNPLHRSSAAELLKHPFILSSDKFDRSALKIQKTNSDGQNATHENSWWESYNTQKKPQKTNGPSHAAKEMIKLEFNDLITTETVKTTSKLSRSNSRKSIARFSVARVHTYADVEADDIIDPNISFAPALPPMPDPLERKVTTKIKAIETKTKMQSMPDFSPVKKQKSKRWAMAPKFPDAIVGERSATQLFDDYYDFGTPKLPKKLDKAKSQNSLAHSEFTASLYTQSSVYSMIGSPVHRVQSVKLGNSGIGYPTLKAVSLNNMFSNVPSTRLVKDSCLSSQFLDGLSSHIPKVVHVKTFAMIKFLNGLCFDELIFNL